MYKKLVRYSGWHFSEVDPICLKRMAERLRDQIISKVAVTSDIYYFHSKTMPIVEAAIRGEILQSLDLSKENFISANYRHDSSEGTLPSEYDQAFASAVAGFSVTAESMPLEKVSKVIVDGVTYGWMEFEEEGDWPHKVKYP